MIDYLHSTSRANCPVTTTTCTPYQTLLHHMDDVIIGSSSLTFSASLAPRGHYIRLTFEGTYGIEGATDCKYDWLTFQDGPFIFSKEIKKLCGNGGNNIVESTGRYMRLIFHTDDVIEEAGFNISFAYLPLPGTVLVRNNIHPSIQPQNRFNFAEEQCAINLTWMKSKD